MTKLERANEYQQQHRIADSEKPVFHVTPPTGWMNDPNGFSVYQGKIHLFYQYYPYSDVWGLMHWGHYVSEDFVKWKELPVALAPEADFDAAGCFSGSAIETEEGQALIYTGVVEEVLEDGTRRMLQQQCLAIGDGVHYKKLENNPVISADMLPNEFFGEDFRDPKVWREAAYYYLAAVSRDKDRNGKVLLFRSRDLKQWEYLSVLADNRGIYGRLWECPDFFALGEKHILVVSPMDMQADGREFHNGNQSMAMLGIYDKKTYQLTEEQVISLDYGIDFYAPQTLLTEDGRRIMIAWMQSWDMNIKPVKQKWNGMMTFPRQLELKNGVLCQSPVEELKAYRVEPVICREKTISGSVRVPGVSGRVLDLTLEIMDGDYEAFTIYFAKNERYYTSFCYVRSRNAITFDRTFSGMERDAVCQRTMNIKKIEEALKLRLLLDKFSVELFVNDGVQTFTAVFYTPMDADEIVLECDNTAVVNIEKYSLRLD